MTMPARTSRLAGLLAATSWPVLCVRAAKRKRAFVGHEGSRSLALRGSERKEASAFTLVELLVVVTIIVLLVALLVPAMSKAIYQAQLARCGSQMKAVAGGAMMYAMNNKRIYMTRAVNRGNSFPYGLKAPLAFAVAAGQTTAFDDRPIHDGYIEIAAMADPLAPLIDLELDSDPNEAIYCNYVMFYGFGYSRQVAMERVGDQWEWPETKGLPRTVQRKFSWLVADLDIVFPNRTRAIAGHPDKKGVLYASSAQAGAFQYTSEEEQAAFGQIPVTFSFWENLAEYRRGVIDLNFAADDGSVIRHSDVEYEYDERMATVPSQRGDENGAGHRYPNRWLNIAKQ